MKTILLFVFLIVILIMNTGCSKNDTIDNSFINSSGNSLSHKILVDASKDGGGWWFPQGPGVGYNISAAHQGKAMADYFRNLGYTVDELPRGADITKSLLSQYQLVIRASGFFNYTSSEVSAYDSFLSKNVSLLLISDHMQYTTNDLLSDHLGVEFAGVAFGKISTIFPHPITTGVTSIPFIAGSAIVNKDKSKMTILGTLGANEYVDLNKNGIFDGNDIKAPPVMGLLQHPTAKIFFISDINGIEQVPQPFFDNLANYLLK